MRTKKKKQEENKYKQMKFIIFVISSFHLEHILSLKISSFYPFLSTISELYLVARVDYFFSSSFHDHSNALTVNLI